MLRVVAFVSLLVASPVHALPLYEITEPTLLSPPFSRNVYRCADCTLAQFTALTPPAGFLQSPPLESVFDAVVAQPVPDPGTAALTLDVTGDVPGDEFALVAQITGGEILGFVPSGPFVRLDIKRETVFTFDAGRVVHELTNPGGDVYLLFARPSDLTLAGLPASTDLEQLGALGSLVLPAGWTYSSRQLASALQMDSQVLADVVTTGQLSFQKLPEPSVAALLLLVLARGLRVGARLRFLIG